MEGGKTRFTVKKNFKLVLFFLFFYGVWLPVTPPPSFGPVCGRLSIRVCESVFVCVAFDEAGCC